MTNINERTRDSKIHAIVHAIIVISSGCLRITSIEFACVVCVVFWNFLASITTCESNNVFDDDVIVSVHEFYTIKKKHSELLRRGRRYVRYGCCSYCYNIRDDC